MAVCDPHTLANDARCFGCVPRGFYRALNVYLLNQIAATGLTPQELLDASSSFDTLSGTLYQASRAYLLAIATGQPTDTATLATASRCYTCIPEGFRGAVENYLYATTAGGSMDVNTLLYAAREYSVLYGIEWRAELYLLARISGITDVQAIAAGAKCFISCLSPVTLSEIDIYLLCLGVTVGSNTDVIPPGSTYPCPSGQFDVTVDVDSTYVITWGADEVSAVLCGLLYPSTGAGNQTIIYTNKCTTLSFLTGACGSTVTVRLFKPGGGGPPVPPPAPATFTWVQNTLGTLNVATWAAPPVGATSTELWTSADDVTYVLAATVAAPGVTASVAAPTGDTIKYAKARYVTTVSGSFTSSLRLFGVVADFAARCISNGSVAISQAAVDAHETFWGSMTDAGINGNFSDGFIAMFWDFGTSGFVYTTPFVRGRGFANWVNSDPGAADLTNEGIKGNGLTMYLDSGATLHDIAGGDSDLVSITLYIATGNSNAEQDMAASGILGPNSGFGLSNFSDTLYYDCNYAAGAGRVATANGVAFSGYVSGNRVANNDQREFRANSGIVHSQLGATNATIPTFLDNPSTGKLMIFDANGAHSGFSTKRYGYCALHTGLTQAQSLAQYNAIVALWTTLGRTVV